MMAERHQQALMMIACCGLIVANPLAVVAAPELKVPDGFGVEMVAGPPMVVRPICADFDSRGFLYVAESSGSNEKVAVQLEKKPHRILRLEDVDGDGIFDKRIVFADGMMFPEGILCHDGAVYCGAPPSIWKLEDTTGDGVADKRSEWWKGGTLTGCANDIHGPYLGPDGLIYWCKGAFAKQTHELVGGRKLEDSAAHIYRCKPDGSEFDSFMSGGMDNPVEIVWGPYDSLFFTTTFFNHPRGGKRDAIVHGVYGAVYPKRHGVLDGLVRTGELMPAMTHLGPAAPCGLLSYKGDRFGPGFDENLFCCQFNTHKVSRHVLRPSGSTFTTTDSDFVTSDSPDFHPTDVLEDRDGSLIVIDTGGWYKLCCPTSQMAKPEVPGGIYRVRRVAPIPELAEGEKDAGTGFDRKVKIPEDPIERLGHPLPYARLLGATDCALARKTEAVPALLAAAGDYVDRTLEHALIYALIAIGDAPTTAAGLESKNPHTRRAALIALDQMDGGEVSAQALRAALDSDAAAVSDAAWWIYEFHPERAGELADYFESHPDELSRLAKFASHPALRPLLNRSLVGALASREESRVRAALPIVSKLDPKSRTMFKKDLAAISRDETIPTLLRLEVIALLPAPLPGELFAFLHGQSDPRAAAQLARADLSAAQRTSLVASLAGANPLQLPHLLVCFKGESDAELGGQLLAALKKSNSLTSLRAEELDGALKKFPPSIGAGARQLLAEKKSALADPARLDKIAAGLPQGDIARGHLVFNGAKAACFSCHAIGYRGGDFGPGLSRIGSIRTERDLLEAIIFPSASIVRSYEPVTVTLRDGSSIIGIINDRTDEAISLRIAPLVAAMEIPRTSILAMTPAETSLMPAGLDQQLSLKELADLIAFLKSMR